MKGIKASGLGSKFSNNIVQALHSNSDNVNGFLNLLNESQVLGSNESDQ